MVEFSKVICLTLPARQDRRDALLSNLKDCNWPFPQPEFFNGADGWELSKKSNISEHWSGWFYKGNPGSYGCVLGHLEIAKIAIKTAGSVLVLEDDAVVNREFGEKVAEFLNGVPEDWEGITLGGFLARIRRISPIMGRCMRAWGAHCYCVRGDALKEFHDRLAQLQGHVDVTLSRVMGSHMIYNPVPFLVGQRVSFSATAGERAANKFLGPEHGPRSLEFKLKD